MDYAHSMSSFPPTDFTCISILVPKASGASSFIRRTFYDSIVSIAFICIVIAFTIGRIIVSKSPFKQWFSILYSTFVVFLTQTTLTPKSIAERILFCVLLFLSVFTTIILSDSIFTNLVDNRVSVRTLNDLVASKYKILSMGNRRHWISHHVR